MYHCQRAQKALSPEEIQLHSVRASSIETGYGAPADQQANAWKDSLAALRGLCFSRDMYVQWVTQPNIGMVSLSSTAWLHWSFLGQVLGGYAESRWNNGFRQKEEAWCQSLMQLLFLTCFMFIHTVWLYSPFWLAQDYFLLVEGFLNHFVPFSSTGWSKIHQMESCMESLILPCFWSSYAVERDLLYDKCNYHVEHSSSVWFHCCRTHRQISCVWNVSGRYLQSYWGA